jgi:uncharacterized protein (TIGR03032 family)
MSSPTILHPREGLSDKIRCDVSEPFSTWLSRAGGSIVLTTYQAGKVGMIGWDGRQVTLLFRDFPKPMGLDIDGPRMLLATRDQVIELANAPLLAHDFLEGQPGRYDALYLPRVAHYTGDLNVHDVAFGDEHSWLVNTRFSCLASPSRDHSFLPRWKPPFISDIVPEDRCHLNGLAMEGGKPRFVTALGETDVVGSWREGKASGGVVIDVASGQVVLRGLSMPHSPRLHDGSLWVLNSGAGELWRVDLKSFRHEIVCSLPGYLRGLRFVGSFALVGLSTIREKHIFGGLPVQTSHPRLRCGVAVVEVSTGRHVGMFEFTEGCTELYDVGFLPNVLRPMILNAEKEMTRQGVTTPEFSYWLRPSAVVTDSQPGHVATVHHED